MKRSFALPSDAGPGPGFVGRTFKSAWRALLLHEDVYPPILQGERPFRRSLGVITLILLGVALATSVGMVFDYLTMPRAFLIQERVYGAITGGQVFRIWAEYNPFLALVFDVLYKLVWFFIRTGQNYPSRFDALYSFFATVVFGIFDWITYVFIAQIVARRLGSTAKRGAFYGPMALAYTPKLLLVANIVPGLSVPSSLVRVWILATGYQATRATFKLPWGRSALVVVLPYFITTLLFIMSLVLGVALGVAVYQILH